LHPGGYALSPFGATIFGLEGTSLTPEEVAFFRDVRPFGFILFARNIETPEQVRLLCATLREAAGHEAPILIDQEGGRVQRLRGPFWREWVPPLEQAQLSGDQAAEAMYARYRIIAHELRDVGIDANCAPLVDLAGETTHPFLKSRCYGTRPDAVTSMGRAVANGLLDGGVLPVIKHIPGHGRATVDSHFDLPTVTEAVEALAETDFSPFHALHDLPMGMTAHVVYAAIDDKPATLSRDVMAVVRTQIGFDGLIMTDDISMKALQGDLSDLSVKARKAGCDVILHCNGDFNEMQQVAAAAGTMGAVEQARADRALKARKTPLKVDIPALDAKLAGFLNGQADV